MNEKHGTEREEERHRREEPREREARLVALLGEREASYAQAHEVVDVDALDAQAVVREIMGALAERERQDGRG